MKENKFHIYISLVLLVLWGCSSPQSTNSIQKGASSTDSSEELLDSVITTTNLEPLDSSSEQRAMPKEPLKTDIWTHKIIRDSIYLEERDGIKAFAIKVYTEAFSLSLKAEEKENTLTYMDYLLERSEKYEPIPYVLRSQDKLWHLPKDSSENWDKASKIIGNFAEVEQAKQEGILLPYIVIYLKEGSRRAEVDSLTQKYQLRDEFAKTRKRFKISQLGEYTIVKARIPTSIGTRVIAISKALRKEKIVLYVKNHLTSSRPKPVD